MAVSSAIWRKHVRMLSSSCVVLSKSGKCALRRRCTWPACVWSRRRRGLSKLSSTRSSTSSRWRRMTMRANSSVMSALCSPASTASMRGTRRIFCSWLGVVHRRFDAPLAVVMVEGTASCRACSAGVSAGREDDLVNDGLAISAAAAWMRCSKRPCGGLSASTTSSSPPKLTRRRVLRPAVPRPAVGGLEPEPRADIGAAHTGGEDRRTDDAGAHCRGGGRGFCPVGAVMREGGMGAGS
mmetsp:Transcript_19062/g.60452  ORF Transcript_19062/g.60452 Transcript_19062/m.60452 type:complete len:239 (+) Transcript_19062:653-1369(+)